MPEKHRNRSNSFFNSFCMNDNLKVCQHNTHYIIETFQAKSKFVSLSANSDVNSFVAASSGLLQYQSNQSGRLAKIVSKCSDQRFFADNLITANYIRTFRDRNKDVANKQIICSYLGRSEKHKSWKMQNPGADSELRHSTDFRTVFGIMIGQFVSCDIGQTYFIESGGRFGTPERPDFK